MEMHQVRYFLAAARLLNFTRAAEVCNVSQPSLTRAIQKLEDEFGGSLFHRERTLTHLTPLGRSLKPHLEQILVSAASAKQSAADISSVRRVPLSVGVAGAVSPARLKLVFSELSDSFPGLDLSMNYGSSEELLHAVQAGQIEAAVIARPEAPPKRLESWLLFRRRLCMVMWGTHRFANFSEVSLTDLCGELLIHCRDDASHLLEREADRCGHGFIFRHKAGSLDQALGLILAGLGSAVLPRPVALPDPLCAVPLAEAVPKLDVVVATMAGRRRSAAAEGFIRAMRAQDWLDR